MIDGVYIVRGGKTYRVHKNARCTKHTCSLIKSDVCYGEEARRMPCEGLYKVIRKAGLSDRTGVNFREVKK